MRITDLELCTHEDGCELRAKVTSRSLREPFPLWYRFPSSLRPVLPSSSGDYLVAALLLPAMKTGEPIELPVPISPQLARSIKRLQIIHQAWDPTLSLVDIHAPLDTYAPPAGTRVGLFFSSGVDAFYSLLRNTIEHPLNEDVIDDLIVIYGADIYLTDGKSHIFTTMLANTQMVAKELGKGVVPVVTNVKELLSACRIRRGFIGHGNALISVGLALGGMFKKVYVAAGPSYRELGPAGNHPLTDPLWSTETCTFIHDGAEANRMEKVRLLAQSEVALRSLRVCWAKESMDYNCGRCAKCLRTMLSLHLAGVLERCQTLPTKIDPEWLRKVPLLSSYEEAVFQELMDALGNSAHDQQLRSALQEGLAKGRSHFAHLAQAKQHLRRLIPTHVPFILVDQDKIRPELGAGRKVIPFLEKDGQYNGLPADDATAIRELERLKSQGAQYIVVCWSEFWSLQYYAGLHQHLRSTYRCVLEDDSLIVFDLMSSPATSA